jgi:hypothetical protein
MNAETRKLYRINRLIIAQQYIEKNRDVKINDDTITEDGLLTYDKIVADIQELIEQERGNK